jgi:hypothetical protein
MRADDAWSSRLRLKRRQQRHRHTGVRDDDALSVTHPPEQL